MDIIFNKDAIELIFPFYVLLKRNGTIESFGKSISKISQNIEPGMNVSDFFELNNSFEFTGSDLESFKREVISIKLKENNLLFKGQVLSVNEASSYLLAINPFFTNAKEVVNSNLDFGDFAICDPIFDYLMLIQMERNSKDESHKSQRLLKLKNIDLEKNNKSLQREIKKRLAVEESLRRSEEILRTKNHSIEIEKKRFEKFVFALNEASIVFIMNEKFLIDFCNKNEPFFSGSSADKVINKDFFSIFSEFKNIEFVEDVKSSLLSQKVWNGEISFRSLKDVFFWYKATLVRFDYDVEEVSYIAVGFDITKRKNLEVSLLESRELEKRANEAKSEFISNVSHEIRTPLNGIIGVADILSDSSLTEEQRELIGVVENSGKILLQVINDILDLSKIESGKMELDLVPTDLQSLLKKTIISHQIEAESKDINFEYSIPNLDYYVEIDPSRFVQIINNLLSNSIKFTDFGFVKFTLEIESETESFVYLKMIFEDTGIGIPTSQYHKIFKEFSQVDPSISRKYGGTGLGLSIVKKLSNLMGADVRFKSQEGKGTQFVFTLKANKVSSEKNNEFMIRNLHKNAGISNFQVKVLVAEDNFVNQKVAELMLSKFGCIFDIVSNGEEVLKKLENHSYDIIFLDCRMPVLDGYQTAKKIRELSDLRVRNIPIVALSANVSDDEKVKCMKVGMNDFLAKPITKKSLFSIFKKYIIQSE